MENILEIMVMFTIQCLGVHGCGKLSAFSGYEGAYIVGRIRLYPDPAWKMFIEDKYYQWTKSDVSPSIVGFFRKGIFNSEDFRVVDVNGTLVITGMTDSDVDVYRVECWAAESRNVFNRSAAVNLRLPHQIVAETTTSEPTTTTNVQTTGTIILHSEPSTLPSVIPGETSNDAGEVSVVIVMTAVIVGLVVVIFGLVIRMKVKTRLKGQQDRRAIAKEEETQPTDDNPKSSTGGNNVSENVYNEIDEFAVSDPDITYAQVKYTQAFDSQGTIPTLGQSPSLPRRDGETSKSVLDVRMTSHLHANADDCIQKATSLQDVYAKVIPKALRANHDNGADQPVIVPEYSSGQGREQMKGDIKRSQRGTIKKSGFQYKSMDCIFMDTETNTDHEYSNTTHTLPRSIKRKGSSKSNTELQYIQIDHCYRASSTGDYAEIEPVVIGETPSSEYVSIDFERKAFVAPIRKAPSSWYRKRKERKEKQKKLK